ncbi:MAG: signal peptidase II [Chloroflexi bacterium]|nr:MAG: signal peptidase II [Chloroflexota bacterium]
MTEPITLYISNYCGQAKRVEKFLLEQNVAVNIVNIDNNPEGREVVKSINQGNASVPTLVFPDGSTLTEPSLTELKSKLASFHQREAPYWPHSFGGWIDWLLPFMLIVLVFGADRLSKQWALQFLAENGPTVLNPWLTILEAYNRGVAFGWFQGVGPLVGWLTIGVVLFMFIVLVQTSRQERLLRYGLAFIIGGALGNQVDRLVAQQVLDFMQLPIWNGALNVADIAINMGMALMIASMIPAIFDRVKG